MLDVQCEEKRLDRLSEPLYRSRQMAQGCRAPTADVPQSKQPIAFFQRAGKVSRLRSYGLKDCTLKSLVLDHQLKLVPDRNKNIAADVICHMLQALDFLSVHDIVHRDVKPDNILYTPVGTGYVSR